MYISIVWSNFQSDHQKQLRYGHSVTVQSFATCCLSEERGSVQHQCLLGLAMARNSQFYLGSYEGEGLAAHNKYRKIHDAKPMKLDSTMSQQAKAYAQRLADMGRLQHSSKSERPGQGENLYKACGLGGSSAQRAVEKW